VIRILLVDDEPAASERMRRLLAVDTDVEVVGMAGSVAEARALLSEQAPDAVFLDVEMPGGNAFGLLPDLSDTTHVVFVTAHERHAVEAFAVNAVDYLLKPVDPERLAEAVRRLRVLEGAVAAESVGTGDAEAALAAWQEPDDTEPAVNSPLEGRADLRVAVPLRHSSTKAVVSIADICWIESLRNYTRVGLRNPAQVLVFRRRLGEWLPQLPENTFVRTSRSEVIQIALVTGTEWRSQGETIVTFVEGVQPLTVGRIAASRLATLLGDERGGPRV
jgi:two-component system LytT family response regulator